MDDNGTRPGDNRPGEDGQPGEATLMAAAAARRAAAAAPGPEALARLLTDATAHPGDLTQEQINALGAAAIQQGRRVSYLLGRLAGLLGEEEGRDGEPG